MKSDADDAGTFCGFNSDVRFKRGGNNTDGGVRVIVRVFTERRMVDGRKREIGDCNKKRFTSARFGFGGIESEENSFETGEGRGIRGVNTG